MTQINEAAEREELEPCPFCRASESPTNKKHNSRVIQHKVGCFFQMTVGSTRIMKGERYKESEYVRAWNTAALNGAVEAAANKGFMFGMAIATANAVRGETWYPDEIMGGVSLAALKRAGVEEYDLAPIRKELKARGKL